MLKVSEILQVKGDALYTASPDAPVAQAIRTMTEQDIGSIVVMEHGELVGMLTFREIIRLMNERGCDPGCDPGSAPGSVGNTPIGAIMNTAPVSVSPDTRASEVQRLMLDEHARYVPVLDGAVLMGVISFYDMARAIVAAQRFENDMLKAYIRDWPVGSDDANEDEKA